MQRKSKILDEIKQNKKTSEELSEYFDGLYSKNNEH